MKLNTTEKEQPDAENVPDLPEPSSVVYDDDRSSESDEVETRPPNWTLINLETRENRHGRLVVSRHSPTENWQTTGLGQHAGMQNDLHKRLRTELAWQQPWYLEHTFISQMQTPFNSTSAT